MRKKIISIAFYIISIHSLKAQTLIAFAEPKVETVWSETQGKNS